MNIFTLQLRETMARDARLRQQLLVLKAAKYGSPETSRDLLQIGCNTWTQELLNVKSF